MWIYITALNYLISTAFHLKLYKQTREEFLEETVPKLIDEIKQTQRTLEKVYE